VRDELEAIGEERTKHQSQGVRRNFAAGAGVDVEAIAVATSIASVVRRGVDLKQKTT
jgi:hypothetical protein